VFQEVFGVAISWRSVSRTLLVLDFHTCFDLCESCGWTLTHKDAFGNGAYSPTLSTKFTSVSIFEHSVTSEYLTRYITLCIDSKILSDMQWVARIVGGCRVNRRWWNTETRWIIILVPQLVNYSDPKRSIYSNSWLINLIWRQERPCGLWRWANEPLYSPLAQCTVYLPFCVHCSSTVVLYCLGLYKIGLFQIELKDDIFFFEDFIPTYWVLQLPNLSQLSFLTHFCSIGRRTVTWGFRTLVNILKNGRTKYYHQCSSMPHHIALISMVNYGYILALCYMSAETTTCQ